MADDNLGILFIPCSITPSASIHSHGSMNENSFATQTTQTGDYWVVHKGDSFDSTSNCYTNDSRMSLNKSCRSRSVPSIKCVYCKRSHGFNAMMKTSESMQYTPRVTAIPGMIELDQGRRKKTKVPLDLSIFIHVIFIIAPQNHMERSRDPYLTFGTTAVVHGGIKDTRPSVSMASRWAPLKAY